MENYNTKLNGYFYMSAENRIRMAENSRTIDPKRAAYLRNYLTRAKFAQLKFANTEMDFTKKSVLCDRFDTINRLLGDYISGGDCLGSVSALPSSQMFNQMGKSLETELKAGRLSKNQQLYLRGYLDKTQSVFNNFNSGSWTPFKKLLYLSRVKLLMSSFHRFVGANTRNNIRQEKNKRFQEQNKQNDISEFLRNQQGLKMLQGKGSPVAEDVNQESAQKNAPKVTRGDFIENDSVRSLQENRGKSQDASGVRENAGEHQSAGEGMLSAVEQSIGVDGPLKQS